MARLQIGNRTVEVDDSFLTMTPQDQQSTVDEIEASLSGGQPVAPPPVPNATPQLPPAQSPGRTLSRDAGLTARAVGRGFGADTLGAFGDAREANDYWGTKAVNLASQGVNNYASPLLEGLASWATGYEPDIPDIPAMEEGNISAVMKHIPAFSGPTSDQIASAAEQAGQSVGINLPEPETPGERMASAVTRFGSGALAGGLGMRAQAAKALKNGYAVSELAPIMQPYAQGGARTVMGDVASGVGAGGAVSAIDEYAPDAVADSPIVRLLAPLIGAVAGAGMIRPVDASQALANKMLPADKILQDPKATAAPRRATANEAASFIQQAVSEKDAAQTALDDLIRFSKEAGGAAPTAGMTGDVGLRLLEKKTALTNPKPFVERYEGMRKSAYNDAARLQNEQADQMAPKVKAEQIIDRAKLTADTGVKTAEQGLEGATSAEKALADAYRAFAGGADNASMQLDKAVVDDTMKPMQRTKSDKYDTPAMKDESVKVGADDWLTTLDAIEQKAAALPPSLKGEVAPEAMIEDLRKLVDGGEVPFKAMTDMRPILTAKEQQARAAKQFPLADSFRDMKKSSGRAAEELAKRDDAAGLDAREANRYYKDEFSPLFNQGEGKKLRNDINRDDLSRTNTPPSETASRFLNGGPEAAADLQRIIAKTPDPAAAKGAARAYVLDSLSKSVIGPDGKVSETGLQKWVNQRSGMLDQMPELRGEVDQLLKDTRSGSAKTSAMKAELEKAVAGKKATEDEINRSALSLYTGRNPTKAAAAMLSSGDPVASIKEVKAAIKGDKAAEEGLKAAIADNLVDSISTARVEDLSFPSLVKSMRKNEAALTEVFGDDVVYLKQARKRLEMLNSKDVQAVAGSSTVESRNMLSAIKKPVELIYRLAYGALEGGSRTRKFNLMADQLPDTSEAVNALLKRAMLDPRVAKHLLAAPVKEIGTPLWNKRLLGYMAIGESNRAASDDDTED